MTYDDLLLLLSGVRKAAPGSGVIRSVRAHCPACGVRDRSLTVSESQTGVLLLCCHRHCATAEIASAAGTDLSELFPARPAGAHARKGIADWISAGVAVA